MDISVLEGLGLTKGEIKTYVTLLELGESTAGPIIEKSRLQSSVVHNCLNSLKDKGLISYVVTGKIKHYQATDPQNILNFVEEKKKELERLLPELLLKQKLAKKKLEAKVFKGNKAVMVMLSDIIKDARPDEEYFFFATSREKFDEEIQDFFVKYDAKRIEKRLVVRGIVPLKLKQYFDERFVGSIMQVRYVDFPVPQNISFFRDKFIIFVWDEGLTAFQITSEILTADYKKLFMEMWNRSVS